MASIFPLGGAQPQYGCSIPSRSSCTLESRLAISMSKSSVLKFKRRPIPAALSYGSNTPSHFSLSVKSRLADTVSSAFGIRAPSGAAAFSYIQEIINVT